MVADVDEKTREPIRLKSQVRESYGEELMVGVGRRRWWL